MNNKFVKWLLLAMLAIYIVSPADLLVGPLDDIIAVIIMYMAASRTNHKIEKKDADIEVIDVDGREI